MASLKGIIGVAKAFSKKYKPFGLVVGVTKKLVKQGRVKEAFNAPAAIMKTLGRGTREGRVLRNVGRKAVKTVAGGALGATVVAGQISPKCPIGYKRDRKTRVCVKR